MGVFFRTQSLRDAITPALATALATDPKTIQDASQAAAQQASQVAQRVAGTFSWLRLVIALALLVLLFCGAVYTGRDAALQQLYTVLLHGLELGLGGVLGLLVGEAAART
jgi:type VI protein secretion system component VasF